jgi:hypothetical protein
MENTGTDLDLVLVQVVDETGREIGWGKDDAERLDARLDDIRRGVASAAGAMSASITGLPQTPAWTLTEVAASFGLTLTAEAGVIVSKVPAGATFEVTLTYIRHVVFRLGALPTRLSPDRGMPRVDLPSRSARVPIHSVTPRPRSDCPSRVR